MDDNFVKKPEDKPILIQSYEFKFLLGKDLVIDVFPSMGDKVKKNPKSWVFTFPRLKNLTQTIHKNDSMISDSFSEEMRVYIPPDEILRRLQEARALAEQEKKDQRAAQADRHENSREA